MSQLCIYRWKEPLEGDLLAADNQKYEASLKEEGAWVNPLPALDISSYKASLDKGIQLQHNPISSTSTSLQKSKESQGIQKACEE